MDNFKVEIKEIPLSDKEILRMGADLVSEYSWGKDYPIAPMSEIEKAEHCIGAFVDDTLVGFSTIGRSYSPDGRDNDQVWFGHAVVIPTFRNRGIFKKMYEKQMIYTKNKFTCIFTCSSNQIVKDFLKVNGWEEIRKTYDEQGGPSTVFKYVVD